MYSVSDLNKEETKKIGKRLLAIRKKLEIMQRDMAKEIGISSGSLSSIESGIYMPRFEQLYHLIGKYNVGKTGTYYDDLFTESGYFAGGGVTYALKSLAGPIELTFMKAKNRNYKGFLSVGFWF